TPQHFLYLGYFLAAFAVVMLFFNANEFIVNGYKLRGDVSHHIEALFFGNLAPQFWTYLVVGLLLPPYLVLYPRTRRLAGIVVAAILVNIGMFLERYTIVVGGLSVPLNPYPAPVYSPSWVEWSLAAAGLAGFVLIILLLLKLVPSVAVWEMEEHREAETSRRVVAGAPRGADASAQTGTSTP
ncbi:MAG: polysulfide reductase NrfD, partial [Chloroflexi bacterium]|nr:polysulfide reductase NrfD [Chloroflexota bacterium]